MHQHLQFLLGSPFKLKEKSNLLAYHYPGFPCKGYSKIPLPQVKLAKMFDIVFILETKSQLHQLSRWSSGQNPCLTICRLGFNSRVLLFHFLTNITGQVPVDFTSLNSVKSVGKITVKIIAFASIDYWDYQYYSSCHQKLQEFNSKNVYTAENSRYYRSKIQQCRSI